MPTPDELYNAIGDGTTLKDIAQPNLELDVPNDNAKINKVRRFKSTLNPDECY